MLSEGPVLSTAPWALGREKPAAAAMQAAATSAAMSEAGRRVRVRIPEILHPVPVPANPSHPVLVRLGRYVWRGD